jgi:hypothetical protein
MTANTPDNCYLDNGHSAHDLLGPGESCKACGFHLPHEEWATMVALMPEDGPEEWDPKYKKRLLELLDGEHEYSFNRDLARLCAEVAGREILALRAALAEAQRERDEMERERNAEGERVADAFEARLGKFYATHGGDGYLGGEGEDSGDPADWCAAMAEHVCVQFIDQRDAAQAEAANMRPVIEAAIAWLDSDAGIFGDTLSKLNDAVRAYRALAAPPSTAATLRDMLLNAAEQGYMGGAMFADEDERGNTTLLDESQRSLCVAIVDRILGSTAATPEGKCTEPPTS